MRRVVLAVALCLGTQLILPTPAQAWWGWWDELSGAGPFWGWELETRLACFGQHAPRATVQMAQAAAEPVKLANELLFALTQAPKAVIPKELPERLKGLKPLDVDTNLIGTFAVLSASSQGAASAPLTATRASDLKKEVSNALTQIGTLNDQCSDEEKTKIRCSSEQTKYLSSVAGRLQAAERIYSVAEDQARQDDRSFASPGVTYSACPLERDVRRHGSINMNFRLLHSYNDRGKQYGGGNEIRLATFVPTVAFRPLYGIGKDWADFVDVSAGAGVYWLTSEGSKSGGFDSITGVLLEPLRLDFHLPTAVTSKGGLKGALLAAPSFRWGLAIFPAGFRENAFGVTQTPQQAERIPAEWVHSFAIFADPSQLIRWLSKH